MAKNFSNDEPVYLVPKVISAAQLEPEKVEWLWPNMIPRGAITMFSGDPGIGKSFALAELASCVVGAKTFPVLFPGLGHPQPLKGRVLWFNSEDSETKTIIPRLIAAGMTREHRDRVFFDRGGRVSGTDEYIESALTNMDLFRKTVAVCSPDLVIVDTLDSFMGDINNNQATAIRSVMTPISKLAEEFNCAVICVRHLSKGAQEKALYRGTGSIALTALARSELFFGFDPDDDTKDLSLRKRVIAQAKCSLGQMSPSIAYRIVPGDDEEEGSAKFAWDGINQNTAEDLVSLGHVESEEVKRAIDEAMAFLDDYLRDGKEHPANEIKKVAKEGDMSWRTIERAKKKLNVQSRQVIDDWGKRYWVWSLKGGDE